jgi:alkylhydroperoxidase family enzyme
VSAHAEFLRAASHDGNLAGQIKSDFRKAKLAQKDLRMLEFVEKLTQAPWLIVESDIASLREAGFRDVEILHIVLGSSHFNYLNRMADGIGIRFEYMTDIPEFKMHLQTNDKDSRTTNLSSPAKRVKRGSGAWIQFPNISLVPSTPDEPRDLFLVMGENPEAQDLARQWRRFQLKASSALTVLERAQLALYMSALNHCDYSIHWFKKLLARLGESQMVIDRLEQGNVPPGLDSLHLQLFAHCRRLTLEPWTSRQEQIEGLQRAGMNDLGVLQLTMLASYLSFENRVALGLGVSIEDCP